MGRLLGGRDGGTGRGGASGGGEPLLLDREEHIPWLAGDEDEQEPGFDARRVLTAAIIGLLVVAAMLAAFFWLWSERASPEIVADGSLIEAPDQPYKMRPVDPGGMEVEGTGDESFAVAEGLERDGRIAQATPPVTDETGTQGAEQQPGAAGGVGVQIGAFPTREEASAAWVRLRDRTAALQGRSHAILEGSADSGTIFRLQALAGSRGEAETLCQAIQAQGGDCQVKR